MDYEARERLAKFVYQVRKKLDLSQRAYGKLIGVSATAVQDWEKLASIPETENLRSIAESSGYSLEELLAHLEGKPLPSNEVELIVHKIQRMPLSDVAVIAKAVGDRLVSVAEGH